MNSFEYSVIMVMVDFLLLISALMFIDGYILSLRNNNKLKKFVINHDRLTISILFAIIAILDLIAIIVYANVR